MAQFEAFSTAGLDPRRKLEHWNDLACSSSTPIVTDAMDPQSFNGCLVRSWVGDICLSEVYSDAHAIKHTRSHVANSREALFFLKMQLEGGSVASQDGREAHLSTGDFALCDTTRPYDLNCQEKTRIFVMGIPDAVMRRYVSSPESVVAVRMAGNAGPSGLLADFLRNFWKQYCRGLDPAVEPRILHTALDLLASAYSTVPQSHVSRTSAATAHRVRIVNYIEAHLGDPDLTPMRIAAACRITTRYLHHLFSAESETVARYILRRRLEECSKALTLPSQGSRTVTAIAFDHGFNSPTHFGRAFRARYGTTPREFRQIHQPPVLQRARKLLAAAG